MRGWLPLLLFCACTQGGAPSVPMNPDADASSQVHDAGRAPPLDAEAPARDAAPDSLTEDAGGPLTLTAFPRRGSATDDSRPAQGPGLLLAGGGADVDAAFVWAHDAVVGGKARGGDALVLRATGADGYDTYLDGLAQWNSVQTLRIPANATARDLAYAARAIDAAEVVFFAGGNQADYVAWNGSPLMRAVERVHARGGVVGGTSAGCAILGAFVNDATLAISESITSKTMMANPYDPSVHFTNGMLTFAPLAQTVTDMHFSARDRMGRLVGFMARQVSDGRVAGPLPTVYGVAVDEGAALLIDKTSIGKVVRQGRSGSAFVVRGGTPDRAVAGQPLIYRDLSVLRVEAPTDDYDFRRHCGHGQGYPLTAAGLSSPPTYAYTPNNPYSASGAAETCP